VRRQRTTRAWYVECAESGRARCYRERVPLWLVYLLLWLTIYRLTRLVIQDTVPPLGWLRERVLNWWEPAVTWRFHGDGTPWHPDAQPHWGVLGRSLRYLFTCPWCMSAWVGAATTAVFTRWVSVPLPWAAWIVGTAVTGFLAGLEDRMSRDG
jgi:hypothetical protein